MRLGHKATYLYIYYEKVNIQNGYFKPYIFYVYANCGSARFH